MMSLTYVTFLITMEAEIRHGLEECDASNRCVFYSEFQGKNTQGDVLSSAHLNTGLCLLKRLARIIITVLTLPKIAVFKGNSRV